MVVKTIDPKKLNQDSLILDVRPKEAIEEKSIALPFISQEADKINVKDFIKKYNLTENGKPLNILCRSGRTATMIAEKFIAEGFNNVQVVLGGIENAEKEGVKINLKKH